MELPLLPNSVFAVVCSMDLHPALPWLWKEPSGSHSSSLLIKEFPPSEEAPPGKPYLLDRLEQSILEPWYLRTSLGG